MKAFRVETLGPGGWYLIQWFKTHSEALAFVQRHSEDDRPMRIIFRGKDVTRRRVETRRYRFEASRNGWEWNLIKKDLLDMFLSQFDFHLDIMRSLTEFGQTFHGPGVSIRCSNPDITEPIHAQR